ncbi:hypothetical protein Syn7502_01270 [Synechococcus sp. PCC 7502]|uniref:hypothetical protein n=1 Tax=Synechococcus sp. PCC 7502 TaxID=1173263 RepID=UPI00029FDA4B|nr:hypothetical protein [Synechococcus sp. PCC 7502]AFY73366.1 hypothetical protein Syn7502_01270 [Synechococcus sp. PCC 7502]
MTDKSSDINSKSKEKKSLGYIPILLILMIISSLIGGIFGFNFGKKSLEGVNPVPLGSKNLTLSPKPKLTPPIP